MRRVDLSEPAPGSVIQGRRLNFLQELPDHGPDPHYLGRFIHQVLEAAPLGLTAIGRRGMGGQSPVVDGSAFYRRVLS